MAHKTRLLDLDFLPYGEALDLMRRLVDVKGSGKWPEILIMLEHEPVLTKGRRAQDSDILVTSDHLADEGISVFQVERGGLITYHGPGQLVVYPVFALHPMKLDVGTLVNGLEQVILDTLAEFGIIARRVEGARGVFVGPDKIASLGVAVRGGVSLHGLALNYDPNLGHFDLINPCGLHGIRMTSMARILGQPVDAGLLRRTMLRHFAEQFGLELVGWSLEQARAWVEENRAAASPEAGQ